MRASELRIGNLIRQTFNPITNLRSIQEVTGMFIQQCHKLENYGSGNINHEGIPITEDWLSKFGFNKTIMGMSKETDGMQIILQIDAQFYYPTIFQYTELSSETEQAVSLNRIEHIHQLQNLYFALTGKELIPQH